MDTNIIFQTVQQDLQKMEHLIAGVSTASSPHLSTMLSHILTDGGKRLRPTITLLAGHLFHYQPDLHLPAAAAIEILHTATLVHDDVIDKSARRRHQATINHLWGNDSAILLGDYLITTAITMAANAGNLRVSTMLAQAIMAITRAEIEENFNLYNLHKTQEQYYRQIADKTAALFGTAATAGALLGKASEDNVIKLQIYGEKLGMAFQIIDDVLDFTSTEERLGKPVASDLRQGTITLPVILFLEKYPDDDSLSRFCENNKDSTLLKKAMEKVAHSPIIPDCYDIARGFCHEGQQALEGLPQGSYRESLDAITELVTAQ